MVSFDFNGCWLKKSEVGDPWSDMPGQRRGCSGCRAHQMHHGSFSHSSVKVAVRCGCADLSFREDPIAHSQAGPTRGIGDAEPGIQKDLEDAVLKGHAKNLGRGRRYDTPDRIFNPMTSQHLSGNSQVFHSAVCARADIYLVHGRSIQLLRRGNLIGFVPESDLWFQCRHVMFQDFLIVGIFIRKNS